MTSDTTVPEKEKPSEPDDRGFDWGIDPDESKQERNEWIWSVIVPPIRSAFLLQLLQQGLPKEQRGMIYFLIIQFHEDLWSPLYVYSAVPALLMWYYPQIVPAIPYAITRGYNVWKQLDRKNYKDVMIPVVLYSVTNYLGTRFISFKDTTELLLEPIFGSASRWPAALLPIFPGMFLRAVNERPNSINGFIPEHRQGIWMAIFVQACTSVLPWILQWPIWTAYTAPSIEYPVMFIDWLICTISWNLTLTSPMGAYAIWLLVNQYRHAESWFRSFGGAPSVVLERERLGTMYYISTAICIQILINEAGPTVISSEYLVLHPQVWIPLCLIFVIGVYLLKYGLLLRIYRFKHKPLKEGPNIRILRLRAQPCLPNSPIQCDIIHTSLRRPPQYIAVSHRWAPVGEQQEMILIDGGLFAVSRSIHSFLAAKRSNLHPRYFWIDSICINQNDIDEKSRQVGMMRNIFEEADMTIGWLGDSPGAKEAFALLRRIYEVKSADSLEKLYTSSAGWRELDELMSNEWFQRIWIVQEIAAAKTQTLRYGDQEMEWFEFTGALARLLSFGSVTNPLLVDRKFHVISALVMEEVRIYVSKANLIKLKDMLKLALQFNATLPIDKVYALLGLVDERHTPLFHPLFGKSPENGKVPKSWEIAKDAMNTMEIIADILGTAQGSKNSRRGRAILDLGTDSAVRYLVSLTRDMHNLTEKLTRLSKGEEEPEEEKAIQPDYSEKASAQLVYIHVARDLVKQNDALSFLCHAGIGQIRNPEFSTLPSWVPDWSTDVQVYVLPWRNVDEPTALVRKEDSSKPKIQSRVFQDAGSRFLLVKGAIVGCITYVAPLTSDLDPASCTTHEQIEKDIEQLSMSYQNALKLASTHLGSNYETENALEKAFCSIVTAGSIPSKDPLTSPMNSWMPVSSIECPISSEQWPVEFKEYWRNNKIQVNQHVYRKDEPASPFDNYRFIRGINSSANSKFAQLVREDIIPSFSQYRSNIRKKGEDKPKEIPSFLLHEGSAGVLNSFSRFVDYTIGRSFAITDSGLMGLVPVGSKEGDLIVRVERYSRVVCLVLREEDCSEGILKLEETSSGNEAKKPKEVDVKEPVRPGTFRLVGEACVHEPEAGKARDLEWFKLW